MPREFIRLKVGTYRRKAFGTDRRPAYPAAAIAAFYGVLELGAEQPTRGQFESVRLLRVLLEGPKGKGRLYARQVQFLIDHGDLLVGPSGQVDVDGWEHLQEGDVTVAERVQRYRNRHANGPANAAANGAANSLAHTSAPGVDSDVDIDGRTADVDRAPELGVSASEAWVFAAIAQAGAFIRPESGMGQRVIGLIVRRGADSVLAELERLAKAGGPMSDRQIVFGLEESLDLIPTAADARAEDVTHERDTRTRRVQSEAAARRVEAFRFTGRWDVEAFGPEPEWKREWGDRPGVGK